VHHPNEEGGLFWADVRVLSFRNLSMGEIPLEAGRGQDSPADKP